MATPPAEVFTTRFAQFGSAVRLGSDQAEDKLMVRLVQAGRVDDVRFLDRIHHFEQGYAGGLQAGEVGHDVELGHLTALHQDRADPVDAIEGRLQIVGGDLPQARLRNGVLAAIIRCERVAKNGKGREGQTVGGDVRSRRQRLRHPGRAPRPSTAAYETYPRSNRRRG